MKSSSTVRPADDDARYVWSFEQRDIDNRKETAFTRLLHLERVKAILSLAEPLVPAGGRIADVGCGKAMSTCSWQNTASRWMPSTLNASFLTYGRRKRETGEIRKPPVGLKSCRRVGGQNA